MLEQLTLMGAVVAGFLVWLIIDTHADATVAVARDAFEALKAWITTPL